MHLILIELTIHLLDGMMSHQMGMADPIQVQT